MSAANDRTTTVQTPPPLARPPRRPASPRRRENTLPTLASRDVIPLPDFTHGRGAAAPKRPRRTMARALGLVVAVGLGLAAGFAPRWLNAPTAEPTPAAPAPQPAPAPTYTVAPGDSLSSIAAAELGDMAHWETIYELNRDTLRSPEALEVGQVLTLPR